MRIVIAEDMALLREGLGRLLTDSGFDVVGSTGDLPGLLDLVAHTLPDVALIDIKMPPSHTDEGLQAAAIIHDRYPATAVLLLSSYLESRYASVLFESRPASSGSTSSPACLISWQFSSRASSPKGAMGSSISPKSCRKKVSACSE